MRGQLRFFPAFIRWPAVLYEKVVDLLPVYLEHEPARVSDSRIRRQVVVTVLYTNHHRRHISDSSFFFLRLFFFSFSSIKPVPNFSETQQG
ncbi:hypothetical protein ACQKWADRAFT_276899 [Trichoderma austrokoningii]